MFTLVLTLSIALCAQGSVINPYDLEDEVKVQLEDLRSNMRGEIFAALRSIDDKVSDVYYHRNNKLDECTISIQQEFETLTRELTNLKELADSANQKIDTCLIENEPLLNQLPQNIIDSFLECIVFANVEVTIIQNEGGYRVDTLMSEADIFEYQIDICAGDFLCLSPLVTAMELAMVNIPQKIGVEVENVGGLCEDLKVEIGSCADSKVGNFAAEGGNIMADITDCVNKLPS